MKFIDILRKLGIFRSGSYSGKYKNAKERGIEMQDQGIFNSKKDLTTKKDLKKLTKKKK